MKWTSFTKMWDEIPLGMTKTFQIWKKTAILKNLSQIILSQDFHGYFSTYFANDDVLIKKKFPV